MSGKDLFYERILHSNDNQTKFTNISHVFTEQKDFCSESIINYSDFFNLYEKRELGIKRLQYSFDQNHVNKIVIKDY